MKQNRRLALKSMATAALFAGIDQRIQAANRSMGKEVSGSINHSVCRWCYQDLSLEELCRAAVEIGIESIELLSVKDFDILKKYNLSCAMVSASGNEYGIGNGWNKVSNHPGIIDHYKNAIDETSKGGFNNLIVFSGNRETNLSDEQGLENCALGLKQIMSYAESKKVTLVMELLNSKVNHPNYMCDKSDWGVELCKRIGSDNFKLLFDIYHMQIMEGDIIATIKKNHPYFAHYHTGGVPGRNEIDDTQELNYPAIMKAIADTGFKGHVAQEFIPKRSDKIGSLKQGIEICSI